MSRKASSSKKRPSRRGVWIFLSLLLIAGLAYLLATSADLSHLAKPSVLWAKLGRPMLRTVFFISIGLLVGQIIESLGWTSKLGRLVWPLINWARLPGPAGAAFTTSFVSGVWANTTLYTSWQEGRLGKRGLIMANLLCNSLPVYVLHLPTTLFIALSLTGQAGVIYMILMGLAALLRFLGVTLVSRIIMPHCDECSLDPPPSKRPIRTVWAETWPKFKIRLGRLIMVIVPVYLVVVMLAEAGFFNWLRDSLAAWVSSAFLPVETMGLVVFSLMAEFTSGFAAAGALLEAGSLSVKYVVLALMIGNIIATPVRALRHQLPQYMGIYTPAFGLQVIAINQTARVLSVVLVTLLFALVY